MTADTAAPPLLDIHTNVVQGLCSLGLIREQLHKPPELESFSQDTVSPSLSTIHKRVVHAICSLGFNCNVNTFDLQRSLVVTDIRIIMITIAVAISIKLGRILRRGLSGSSDLTPGCRTCMSVALINYLKLKRLEHQQPVESSWQQAPQQHLTCAKWCQLRQMASLQCFS